jgi:hypothetical protein
MARYLLVLASLLLAPEALDVTVDASADASRVSIDVSSHGVTHSLSDVKELVPELYTTPAVLVNSRALPLGATQAGAAIKPLICALPFTPSQPSKAPYSTC